MLAACSSPGGGQVDSVSGNGSRTSGQVDSSVVGGAANATDGGASSSPFVVKVGSGYLRDLMDSTFGKDDVDYHPILGANDALDSSSVVVAGYLVEIVAGVTEADISVRRRLTQTEIDSRFAALDERERLFEAEGASEADWRELEQERRSARANELPKLYDFNYAAYRVRVTEVIKGDINVGDLLDVQVYAGVNVASEWVDPVLVGTPRVVVAGGWGRGSSLRELRDATGKPVDRAFWPHIDLFWLDEGVWKVLEDDTSGAISETGGAEGSGSVPGGLLEDDSGGVAVVDESLVERPAPIPEAHYLGGLHGLDEAWGTLETLDDLAAALRSAAAERSPPTTTTAAPGGAMTTTSVADAISTTIPLP